MTDVLIKNCCIPECCMDCDPDFAYAINCKAYNENNNFTRQRAENCPLVEIKNSQDGDTIYRADAIEAIFKVGHEHVDEKVIPLGAVTDYSDAIKSLPSAEAVQGWIPFTRRPMTEEEQEDYPNCTFIFDCVLPDDGDEILVSNGRFVWMDTFCNDIDGCYLDGGDDIDEDMAWMPLPKPYKGGDSE